MQRTSLIDEYLDALAGELRVEAPRARRILAETEAHLEEAVEAHVAAGVSREDAERLSIERFGPAREIAARFNAATEPVGTRTWFFRLYVHMALLAGIGLLAIGIAGELAAGFGLAFGKEYVSGDEPGRSYTAARCADFLEYYPGAADCETAATLHHFDETWRNADAALVLGIGVVAAHLWLRRRAARGEARTSLPRLAFGVFGMLAFGLAGVALLGYGSLGLVLQGGTGMAPFIIAGSTALVFFAAFLAPGVRSFRTMARAYAG